MPKKLTTALDAISQAMEALRPPRASKELTSPAKRARAYLGITEDPMESGYILPSGEFLNMSGVGRDISDFPRTAEDIAGMSFQFEPGRRNLPHAVTKDVVDMDVQDFLDAADVVRFDPGESIIEASKIPTAVQRYRAAEAAADMFSDIFAEATDPITGEYIGAAQLAQPSPGRIKRFYDEKIARRGLRPAAQELLLLMDQGNPRPDRAQTLAEMLPDDPVELLLRGK